MTAITLESAHRAAAAAQSAAAERGITVVVTIVDAGVQPVLIARQDAAPIAAIDASLSKARTTLYFGGAATADLSGATAPGGPLFGFEHAVAAPLAFIGGAVPVRDAQGSIVGAVGVGGGSAEQDHEIATAAAAAIGASA
ncbi:heme-binding protein [Microbacterium sp. W4I20]|uniref:heme-binding protein n=1 Tax=Microbacterium sp. W4I20 TaxID=3042262 RepID=UPI0027D7B0E4|nr:heme-binding protein [Microbacterium sp. W4I20]